jgi:hypothetical protein
MSQGNMSPPIATCVMLVSCLAYSFTLNLGATCSSGMSADFQWTTWCYIPEDRSFHAHRSENVESYRDGECLFLTPTHLLQVRSFRIMCHYILIKGKNKKHVVHGNNVKIKVISKIYKVSIVCLFCTWGPNHWTISCCSWSNCDWKKSISVV